MLSVGDQENQGQKKGTGPCPRKLLLPPPFPGDAGGCLADWDVNEEDLDLWKKWDKKQDSENRYRT